MYYNLAKFLGMLVINSKTKYIDKNSKAQPARIEILFTCLSFRNFRVTDTIDINPTSCSMIPLKKPNEIIKNSDPGDDIKEFDNTVPKTPNQKTIFAGEIPTKNPLINDDFFDFFISSFPRFISLSAFLILSKAM